MLKSMDRRMHLEPSDFFDEFYPRVFRFVASRSGAAAADVDDLVQETLLHAWRNRAQFRQEASLLTWVLSIARNRIRMRHRSLARKTALEAALRDIDREVIPSGLLHDEETAGAVRRALEEIDPALAEVLVRRYYEGKAVHEIAESSGESPKAVESRLHRAREALRTRLLEGGTDEL